MQHPAPRTCDICDEVIPRGTPYRAGYTIPDALAEALSPDPTRRPTYTLTPDGLVRFELCLRSWGEMGERGALLLDEEVDPLQ
jgi:hypothetical protein